MVIRRAIRSAAGVRTKGVQHRLQQRRIESLGRQGRHRPARQQVGQIKGVARRQRVPGPLGDFGRHLNFANFEPKLMPLLLSAGHHMRNSHHGSTNKESP
jgi:hypothetical protein